MFTYSSDYLVPVFQSSMKHIHYLIGQMVTSLKIMVGAEFKKLGVKAV